MRGSNTVTERRRQWSNTSYGVHEGMCNEGNKTGHGLKRERVMGGSSTGQGPQEGGSFTGHGMQEGGKNVQEFY